jgi:hypothetical protein
MLVDVSGSKYLATLYANKRLFYRRNVNILKAILRIFYRIDYNIVYL